MFFLFWILLYLLQVFSTHSIINFGILKWGISKTLERIHEELYSKIDKIPAETEISPELIYIKVDWRDADTYTRSLRQCRRSPTKSTNQKTAWFVSTFDWIISRYIGYLLKLVKRMRI